MAVRHSAPADCDNAMNAPRRVIDVHLTQMMLAPIVKRTATPVAEGSYAKSIELALTILLLDMRKLS